MGGKNNNTNQDRPLPTRESEEGKQGSVYKKKIAALSPVCLHAACL